MHYFFVEHLQIGTWLFAVWPRVCRMAGKGPAKIFYVEGARLAAWLARTMAGRRGFELARLDFDAGRIFDARGTLIWHRTRYGDMLHALAHLRRQPVFRRFLEGDTESNAFKTYSIKQVLPGNSGATGPGFWRSIFLVHVCLWRARSDGLPVERAALFLRRWPWMAAIGEYARDFGLQMVFPLGRQARIRDTLRRLAGPDALLLKETVPHLFSGRWTRERTQGDRSGPRLALQYYGQFNLDQPERYSDLFFWQQSEFPGDRLLVLFGMPRDPLDRTRLDTLSRHGMYGLATRFGASAGPEAPVHVAPAFLTSLAGTARILRNALRPPEIGWLDTERTVFDAQKNYWKRLFARHGVKVFTSWYKYDGEHCAIAEALQELGGALAIYQRSYEGEPCPEGTLVTDVYFGFSSLGAKLESLAGSWIGQFVTTGYLGDHRFRLVRSEAERVRNRLRQHGAQYVLAYFDEGSHRDARWGMGAWRLREPYAYLLEAVLREPGLGLVLKPKVPGTLRQRLGEVTGLLDRALQTGRCYLYHEGVHHGSVTPAQAALSADLAVHGALVAATAACEAALAGVPTAFLDEDGWISSPLHRLGVGKVIFNDWASLWRTWRENREQPGSTPGFADWAPVLDELDPFRDGRAAERMGTYLQWLIEGFTAGESRELALARAAERYAAAWGEDKVVRVLPAP